jgi:glutaredoxin
MKYIRLYVFGCGLFLGLFMTGHAIAEIIKWVDKFGIIHIQDSPQVNTPEKKSQIKIDPKVELYVTSWCPWSQKALKYFQEKGVSFTAYDIEKDPGSRRRQKEINPSGSVPTVVINGNVYVGYSANEFDRMLKESR